MTTLIIILCSIIAIYLMGVLRIYSLTLYYKEFDGTRKYTLIAPINIIKIFLYLLTEKKDGEIMRCIVFHFPTFYKVAGLQCCLISKKMSKFNQKILGNLSRNDIYYSVEQIISNKKLKCS